MAKTYTLDASVLINAFNPSEAGHDQSNRLLARLQGRAVPLIEPTLLLPEIAAAVRRGRGDARLARQFTKAIERLPHLLFIPLDDVLARQAADIAAGFNLRGSDAVYAAVAQRFSCTLVTLDKEQAARIKKAVVTANPADLLDSIE